MDKLQAKTLIANCLNAKFNNEIFREFIVNLLDKIDEQKAFFIGNAQVKEAYQKYVSSYKRIGQYTDSNSNIIDVLTVHLKDNCSLDRNRTMLRNFVADYMKTRQKENALVAFYNDSNPDWRFSFVKLELSLKQDESGKVKVINEFSSAKRFSFLVGELEPNHTAQSRLVSLLEKEFPTLGEIEEAFNVEKVSKEFFANYKELFLQLVDDLKEIRKNDSRINTEFTLKLIKESDFCKKLLGQLVFLYFIQKKGWLGVQRDKKWGEGDKQFLRNLFKKAVEENRNFFNDYLEPLFYNALANGERDNNWCVELNCKIPFLNGGLFETIGGYSWTETDIILDNSIFSNKNKTKNGDIGDGILDVFDRYNFTVKEDEPLEKEVAVDPEMLGKVFEELLEVEDRKSKGAFYTPREIVHYMCQESLINYLSTELNALEEDINLNQNGQLNLIEPENKQLNLADVLTKKDISDFIHYCDNYSQTELIATQKEGQNTKYQHKFSKAIEINAKAIDKALENIKICDPAIGSGAFPVGMLNEIVRARIALVEFGFLKEAKKRSIYEYKRQAIQNSIYGVDIESGAVEIAKLRLWLSLVVDEEDIENIKALPNLDYKIVCGNSLLNVERNLFNDGLFKRLEELKPRFFNETIKSEKRKLKKEIDAIIKDLTKDGTFDFEIYFSEVFHEKGGFDVIIANPPYVEVSNKDDKLYFSKKYDEVLSKHYDLYIFFFKKGHDILKKNGVLAYITPHTYISYSQFIALRKFLYNHSNILELLNKLSNVFQEAVVDTSIILLQKINKAKCLTKFTNNEFSRNKTVNKNIKYIRQCDYSYDNFDIDIIENTKKIKKYYNNSWCLSEITDSTQGITVYAKVQGEKINYFRDSIEDVNSKKVLRGREIFKYTKIWQNSYIQYGDWLWCKRNPSFFENEKIFLRQTADKLIATYIEEPFYCIDSIHSIILKKEHEEKINLKYILALINSNFLDYIYKNLTAEQGKVFAQVKLTTLRKMPIKIAKLDVQNKFISIVDKILAVTQTEDYLQNEEKQNAVKEYEKQIDIMVYKLYELTYDEVLTIDKDFALTEQQFNDFQL